MKHITTLDWAYWVRFFKGTGIAQHMYKHMLFSYEDYGSVEAALEAAIEFRDKHLPEHEKQAGKSGGPKVKGKFYKKLKANNTTGHTGVQYREKENQDGTMYMRYCVTWMEKGKSQFKSFPFNYPFEKEMMYEKAVRFRKRMERQHYKGKIG